MVRWAGCITGQSKWPKHTTGRDNLENVTVEGNKIYLGQIQCGGIERNQMLQDVTKSGLSWRW